MKKRKTILVMGWLAAAALAFAGCTAAPAELQEAIEQVAPTLQAAATELAPTVRAAVEDIAPTVEAAVEGVAPTVEAALEGAGEEPAEGHGEAAGSHEVTCVPADVPLPTAAEAMVRFVNGSGNEMTLSWRDLSSSPPQLVEYAKVANGDAIDQESFPGHEWVMTDHDGKTLDYAVTSDPQQCVVLHHWSYEGETGPENWAELREEYESCGAGVRQSPIDLGGAGAADLENIVFEYGETPVNLLNNGHTIQVDKIVGNQIVLGEVTYPLRQFHFHAPSEHIEGGEYYPLEMHLVHQLDSGERAVVGVFIAVGAENSAFAPVWDNLSAAASPAVTTAVPVDVAQLLPADRQVYAYSGSLTTPPCDEEVKWFVMNEPVEMSAEQIAAFTDIFTGNNRPLQGVENRDVTLDESP